MSAHRILQDLLEAPFEDLQDPGNGNTIGLDRDRGFCRLAIGSGSETRTLAAPTKAGQLIAVGCSSVNGGTAVLTVTGTYDGTNSTITFAAASNMVLLYGIVLTATTYRWTVLTNVGATGPSQTINGLTIADGGNIAVGSTTGTQIGTAVTQKLGFFGAAPVVQPTSANQAVVVPTQDTITDSTGGAASTTFAAIVNPAANATTSLTADVLAIKNALASSAAENAKIKTDIAALVTLTTALRSALVNEGLIKGS